MLRAEGRVYPVKVRYLGGTAPTAHNLVERVEAGIKRALKETAGNILVFLPGKGEINACHDTLRKMQYPKEFSVNGAKFSVEYHPSEKLVMLRWERGIRQPTLSSVLLPRWNNWKVQLDLLWTGTDGWRPVS